MILRNHSTHKQIENRCRCACHGHGRFDDKQVDRCKDCGCPKTDAGWKTYEADHPQHISRFKPKESK